MRIAQGREDNVSGLVTVHKARSIAEESIIWGEKCSMKWPKDHIIVQEKNLHIVLNITKQLQFRAKIVQNFQESEAPESHQV